MSNADETTNGVVDEEEKPTTTTTTMVSFNLLNEQPEEETAEQAPPIATQVQTQPSMKTTQPQQQVPAISLSGFSPANGLKHNNKSAATLLTSLAKSNTPVAVAKNFEDELDLNRNRTPLKELKYNDGRSSSRVVNKNHQNQSTSQPQTLNVNNVSEQRAPLLKRSLTSNSLLSASKNLSITTKDLNNVGRDTKEDSVTTITTIVNNSLSEQSFMNKLSISNNRPEFTKIDSKLKFPSIQQVNELAAQQSTKPKVQSITNSGAVTEKKRSRLDDYDIFITLGTGTFGQVRLVKSKIDNKYYALKSMPIVQIIKRKQVQHVKNEKNILENLNHPFIIKLYWTSHDRKHLYLMLEYVPGGELFSLLRTKKRLELKAAVFYACEIVCALEYLHLRSIVYRDLKPENILLDIEGHIKLADMGFSKKIVDKTYTLCGTPEYLAPEVLANRGHNFTCDWWSLGIIIYEFLSGSPPFYDENRDIVYQKILSGKIEWPRHFDSRSKDLIKKLLVADPSKRLGSGNVGLVSANAQTYKSQQFTSTNKTNIDENSKFIKADLGSSVFLTENILNTMPAPVPSTMNPLATTRLDHRDIRKQKINQGSEEVKTHDWFISITNWNDVYERRMKPPFVPEIANEGDTRYFEKYEETDLSRVPSANDSQLDCFKDF